MSRELQLDAPTTSTSLLRARVRGGCGSASCADVVGSRHYLGRRRRQQLLVVVPDTNVEPGGTDNVFFPTPRPGGFSSINLSAGEIAQSLVFQDSYDLTGGDLTFSTTGTGAVVCVAGTSNTISSALKGTVGVQKGGPGTLTLTGASSFTGTVRIALGTLIINGNAALGAAANGVELNTTLRTTGTFSMARAITVGAGGTATIEVDAGGTVTNSGALAANANHLNVTGADTLVLSGASSRIGTTLVSNGVLRVGNNTALGSGVITVDSTAALEVGNTVNNATPVSMANSTLRAAGPSFSFQSGAVTVPDGSGVQVRLNGGPSGAELNIGSNVFTTDVYRGGSGATTIVEGAGMVSLTSANNTYAGSWTVLNGATLRANSTTALGTGTDPILLQGGTFTLFGDNDRNVQLKNGSAVRVLFSGSAVSRGVHTIAPGAQVRLGGYPSFFPTLTVGDSINDLTGGGAGSTITIDAAASVRLEHGSDYVGNWSIKGNLAINADSCLGDPANSLTLDGGTLANTAALTSARNLLVGAVQGGVSLSADAAYANVSGAGSFYKGGAARKLTVNHVRTGGLAILIGSMAVAPNGTATGTSRVENLSIDTGLGAKLDLGDNKLIVANAQVGNWNGSTYTGLSGLIRSAHNAGAWDGNGMTTSMPDAQSGLTGLGIATADQAGYAGGTFGGVSVAATDVLVMYTYAGDANLDGFISGDDYSAIDFAAATPGASGWTNGDFNWDGIISGDDYSMIDFNIVAQGPPIPTGAAAGTGGAAPVPEPSGVVAVAAAASLLLARRRRSTAGRCGW